MKGSRLSFLQLLLATVSFVQGQDDDIFDLTNHYCRIWRHASVVADGKVYIDGGNTMVPRLRGTFNNTLPGTTYNGTHQNLLVLDLSKNFSTNDSTPYRSIRKAGSDVPTSLIEHGLWYSQTMKKVYQVGGWFSSHNDSDPGFVRIQDIPTSAIWEFDTASEKWSKADGGFELRNTGRKLDRPGAAAYCNAPALNMGFMFQGYVQQRSDIDYATYSSNIDFKFLSGMLALDTSKSLSKPRLTNISTPLSLDQGKTPFGPRMNGGMVHVPVGSKGIVVQIGGQVTNDKTAYGERIRGANSRNKNMDLSFVDIYDVESGFWFRQRTWGIPNIPSGRSDFCLAVVSAKDGSSHNIYMVAGMEDYSTRTPKAEIWVLSLPSFNWVLVSTEVQALYGHTCHAVGENLLIIGGMKSRNNMDDVFCDDHMPANVFSLATETFPKMYDASGATRQPPVSDKVIEVIGGNGDGGAHTRSPRIWDDVYLQFVFNPDLTRPAYTPTYVNADGSAPVGGSVGGSVNEGSGGSGPNGDSEHASGDNKGAIIGGAVGGVIGFLVLVVLGVFLYKFLRQQKAQRDAEAAAAAATWGDGRDSGQKLQDLRNRHQSELPAYNDDDKTDYSGPFQHVQIHNNPFTASPVSGTAFFATKGDGVNSINQSEPAELPVPRMVSEVEGSPASALMLNLPASSISRPTTAYTEATSSHPGHMSLDSTQLAPSTVGLPREEDGLGGTGGGDRVVSQMSPEMGSWARFRPSPLGTPLGSPGLHETMVVYEQAQRMVEQQGQTETQAQAQEQTPTTATVSPNSPELPQKSFARPRHVSSESSLRRQQHIAMQSLQFPG